MKNKEVRMKDKGKITAKYNLALFSLFLFFETVKSILEYKEEPATLLDKIFDYDALIGTATLSILFVLSSVGCIWILRSFWERCISNIFDVRTLTINESIGMLLVFAILSVS